MKAPSSSRVFADAAQGNRSLRAYYSYRVRPCRILASSGIYLGLPPPDRSTVPMVKIVDASILLLDLEEGVRFRYAVIWRRRVGEHGETRGWYSRYATLRCAAYLS